MEDPINSAAPKNLEHAEELSKNVLVCQILFRWTMYHGAVDVRTFPCGQGPVALIDLWIDLFWSFPAHPRFNEVVIARSMQNSSGRCPPERKKAEPVEALPLSTNRVADQCLYVLTSLREARDLISPLFGDQKFLPRSNGLPCTYLVKTAQFSQRNSVFLCNPIERLPVLNLMVR
jgi:hypothetical protein